MLKNTLFAGLGLSLLGTEVKAAVDDENVLSELIEGPPQKDKTMADVPFERHETVRLAIIGTGLRGRSVLGEFVNVPTVRVTALCDIVQEKADRAKTIVTKAGQPEPAVYVKGERGYGLLKGKISTLSLLPRRGNGTFRRRLRR